MCKKVLAQLVLCGMIVLTCWFSIKTLQFDRVASTPAFKLQFMQGTLRPQMAEAGAAAGAVGEGAGEARAAAGAAEESAGEAEEIAHFFGMPESASSGQRVVEYELLEQTSISLPQDEYDVLLRIVEAEAGNEDETGRMLVAGVVLNRVKDDQFPDTVAEVVFQQTNGTCQFSPVSNGRFYTVEISETTRSAVNKVLSGEDVTAGALYFASRKYADPEKMKWFDTHLTKLFTYGGHEFFQ